MIRYASEYSLWSFPFINIHVIILQLYLIKGKETIFTITAKRFLISSNNKAQVYLTENNKRVKESFVFKLPPNTKKRLGKTCNAKTVSLKAV